MHDVALLIRIGTNILLAKHFIGRISDLCYGFDGVNAATKSIFFEPAFSSPLAFHLGFNDELARCVVRTKRSGYVEGFLCCECDVTSWDWNHVFVHDLRGLILM